MSGEELALETQLLLQSVTQINQRAAVESLLEDADVTTLSKYEADKDALLTKLLKKKEANQARQQLHLQRHGLLPELTNRPLYPRKQRAQMPKLPIAAPAAATSNKKKNMLSKLKMQAIQQGAQNMAKLFGYSSYEEHLKYLNKLEKMKIEKDNVKENEEEVKGAESVIMLSDVNDEDEKKAGSTVMSFDVNADVEEKERDSNTDVELAETCVGEEATSSSNAEVVSGMNEENQESVKIARRFDRNLKRGASEEDGNEADSEQDENEERNNDEGMEDTATAIEATKDARQNLSTRKEEITVSKTTPKDKAAGYRNLLRAEALQNRKRKKLIKSQADNFVESEAEEDEEENALNIGGLGDFGFGVPQPKTQESKDAEEERNALKIREGDLDYIVDDLSDDEQAQEQDLEDLFRREQEDNDRQQVKEVMRNVKEGFGRNRHAFSGSYLGSGARGRFNLDELVAADGSKFEAARLGLLESDEELSDNENDSKKKRSSGTDGTEGEEEQNEEEDEEAEMERMLRERFLNQPKIYMTSSESGSDDEEEVDKEDDSLDRDEAASDEERERQQMKLFSERARINRRMQRMKDMQRQIALKNNETDPTSTTMPNFLLEEEDSQELMDLIKRTNVDSTPSNIGGGFHKKSRLDRPHQTPGQRISYGGIASASRASSSFSHVIGQCKMFGANSAGDSASSKSFVFTSFSKTEDEIDNSASKEMETMHTDLKKSSGANMATNCRALPGVRKRPDSSKTRTSGGLFSALSLYQCVSTVKRRKCSHPED